MIKLIYCISKRPDLTDNEFFHYWKYVHGPMTAKIPGLRRLVQCHTMRVPSRPADFDGQAELWFDSLETLAAARQSPEWQASSADEANFIDPRQTAYFLTEEHEIL